MSALLSIFVPYLVRDGEWRFRWGSIHWGFALAIDYSIDAFGGPRDEEHGCLYIALGFPKIFIYTPPWFAKYKRPDDHPWFRIFGFKWPLYDSWHISWKGKTYVVDMPYSWSHVRHTLLKPDGSVHADFTHSWKELGYERRVDLQKEVSESHPYTYILNSGELQNRIATIHGEEREWRWRMCKWLPFPRKISRVIDIEFNEEVGERSGSWKGGAIGISSEWRKGETMLSALRRCELTRKL